MKPQTASQEILSKKELIKQILTDFPETRDCDRKCQIAVWKYEGDSIGDYGFNFAVSTNIFFEKYEQGLFTSSESISRLKRLIQKECPELAGINKDSEEEAVREIFTGELNFPNQ